MNRIELLVFNVYLICIHGCNYNDPSMQELLLLLFIILGTGIQLFLSYNFTKKRPFKIFKIENFNRQTRNKIMLILTK